MGFEVVSVETFISEHYPPTWKAEAVVEVAGDVSGRLQFLSHDWDTAFFLPTELVWRGVLVDVGTRRDGSLVMDSFPDGRVSDGVWVGFVPACEDMFAEVKELVEARPEWPGLVRDAMLRSLRGMEAFSADAWVLEQEMHPGSPDVKFRDVAVDSALAADEFQAAMDLLDGYPESVWTMVRHLMSQGLSVSDAAVAAVEVSAPRKLSRRPVGNGRERNL